MNHIFIDNLRRLRADKMLTQEQAALRLGVRDAKFSKTAYYNELGLYNEAYALWREIIEDLKRVGYESEMAYPLAQTEKCREKMRVRHSRKTTVNSNCMMQLIFRAVS